MSKRTVTKISIFDARPEEWQDDALANVVTFCKSAVKHGKTRNSAPTLARRILRHLEEMATKSDLSGSGEPLDTCVITFKHLDSVAHAIRVPKASVNKICIQILDDPRLAYDIRVDGKKYGGYCSSCHKLLPEDRSGNRNTFSQFCSSCSRTL